MSSLRPAVARALSAAWGVTLGGTFACVLPYLLGDWRIHQIGAGRLPSEVIGGVIVVLGVLPICGSFVVFVRAGGTPIPLAAPPRLVIRGCYRYVRNPIYLGFLVVLIGQTVLFGSLALLRYTAVAFCFSAAVVRFHEEPVLGRRFGHDYAAYKAAVRAWVPRLHPWPNPPPGGSPGEKTEGPPTAL